MVYVRQDLLHPKRTSYEFGLGDSDCYRTSLAESLFCESRMKFGRVLDIIMATQ